MKAILKTFAALFAATAIFALASCQQETGPGTVATYVYDMTDLYEGSTGLSSAKMTCVIYDDNTFVTTASFSGSATNANNAKITFTANFDTFAGTWDGDFSKDGDIKVKITKEVDDSTISTMGLTETQQKEVIEATSDTTINITSSDVKMTEIAEADQEETTATLSNETKTLTIDGMEFTKQ